PELIAVQSQLLEPGQHGRARERLGASGPDRVVIQAQDSELRHASTRECDRPRVAERIVSQLQPLELRVLELAEQRLRTFGSDAVVIKVELAQPCATAGERPSALGPTEVAL